MPGTNATDWQIPQLWVPFSVAFNEETLAMTDSIQAWVMTTGLYCSAERAALSALAGASGTAYTMPAATGDCAMTLARYMSWGFHADDIYDAGGESDEKLVGMIRHTTQLIDILENPELADTEDDGYFHAWADIARGLHRLLSPRGFSQMSNAIRVTKFGWLQQASLARQGALPTFAGFMPYRYASGAGNIVACMIDLSVRDSVPHSVIELDRCRQLSELAIILSLLDNELLSRNKEVAGGEWDTGLIHVLVNEFPQLSVHDATDTAIALRDRLMTAFVTLRERLLEDEMPGERIYVDALTQYIAGVVKWTSTSVRYTLGRTPALRARPDHAVWEPPLPPWFSRWECLAS